ncbi:MAG: tetratricopeptide repeat protein [Acidobacteria bacterium]|nr:tetratricopeptide repeat protein [Acidobacteriota bacterium]
MTLRLAALALLVVTPFGMAQKKNEMAELNREIGLLRDDMLKLQEKMDENLANIKAAIQATLEQVNATNRNLAVLDKAMRDKFKEQEQALNVPIIGLGTKVDTMGTEFSKVKESVADLSTRMGKIQQQLVDLDTAVKVRAAPPEPPPGGVVPPSSVSATSLWESAQRDMSTNNYELALIEFNDYLKYFPATDSAPEAQFNIGRIFFAQGRYEDALVAFDAVLEKYPDNSKTLDSRLMKGKTLVKLNRRNDGVAVFRALVKDAKGTEAAGRAAEELKALGLSATPPSAPRRGKKQ